jgi:uncharacterized protein involved in response to NO
VSGAGIRLGKQDRPARGASKWLPVFLGLQPTRGKVLLAAVGGNTACVIAAFLGWISLAVTGFAIATVAATIALRLFAHSKRPPKLNGVRSSLPLFVRLSYIWALVAAMLGVWASFTNNSHGIWGASRHALTVGFLSTMVFAIGQRILPVFSGMKMLFSTKLMLAALTLLTFGCASRVSSEILAYEDFFDFAWSWLPVSAVTEMIAVTLFASNLILTFMSERPSN